MDKLETFQRNDPRKLFELAKKLNERSFFEIFLNETQFKIIDYILSLNNFEIWTNFLEGNCYISYLKPEDKTEKTETPKVDEIEKEDTENAGEIIPNSSDRDIPTFNNIIEKNETNKETLHSELDTPETLFPEGAEMSKKLALHVRYLLWEKAIDFYYSSKRLDESNNILDEVSDDYQLIDSLDNIQDENPSNESETKQVIEKPKVREEDDDYDDDDEDDEEENDKKQNATDLSNDKSNLSENMLVYNSNEQLVLDVPLSIFKAKQQETNGTQGRISNSLSAGDTSTANSAGMIKPLESSNEDQDKLIQEFNKVYHNFEYDRETLLKRRKLEKSDKQLESKKTNKGDDSSDPKSAAHIDMNLGAASTSLQHLLSTIQSKRDEVPLNDHELRTLFMDIRKNRGKWANDDRVGQEELYEACEKVVTELRGYTEHSTFFLNKVSKREAPNYGLIIKKPMDLNTVLKKLKNLAYNSKQEFVDDLMLIWSNCLTYNADPSHFIRAHAVAMQKKTIKLIPTIPDIKIRSRAEVEKEEEVENGKRDDEEDTLGGKSMKKGRKRSRQDEIKAEAEIPHSPSPAGTPLPSDTNSVHESTPAPTDNGNLSNDEEEEEEEDADNINGTGAALNGIVEADEEEFDPELQAWRTLTAKSRANYCEQRADLFDENGHLKSDAPAICRKSNEMSNFNEYLNNKEVISKSKSLLENDEPYLLEYDVAGGIPGIAYQGVDKESEESYENKLVDIYLQQASGDASKLKSDFVLSTNSGLNKVYFENICEIQEIRKICFKISLIRQMQTQQFVHHTQMKQPEIQTLKEVDVDAASKLPNHDISTGDVQFSVFRRNIAKIAMQTGFETTQPAAINTLTQVAERYLGNLIKSLKLHSETTSYNRLSPRELLLLSLLENGVDRPDDLYTFVQERVVKQQAKLKDLRLKLSNFLKDLLRPGLENFSEKSFEDNSEQFMTGDFSNGLGDDFFGFKELGLDKEFKMLTSSIPVYLLHSRLHNQFTSSGSSAQRNKYEDLQEYEPEKIHGNEIEKQIGILIPFYKKLYEKSQTFYVKAQKKKGESLEIPPDDIFVLTEDEDLPQKQRNVRPKLPPTGRISSIKKKIIANSFFLPEEEELQKQEMELKAKEERDAAQAAQAMETAQSMETTDTLETVDTPDTSDIAEMLRELESASALEPTEGKLAEEQFNTEEKKVDLPKENRNEHELKVEPEPEQVKMIGTKPEDGVDKGIENKQETENYKAPEHKDDNQIGNIESVLPDKKEIENLTKQSEVDYDETSIESLFGEKE
ncbi:subunit of the histone acetyltransferase SAGA complex, putative [Candida dubliniensis CD36]|uniref:SAGA complex subunit Spt7 n=1 Tax=Candida dubliniensis (strain CD36 / ATCC MYA-646 / CBS 7987 / NCPF 3949 / NRRL Y-17841) TaxID=573826 RepID=B9WN02_CANDC|nr:subunit of the histone acetyltransferase SAGA complex, putative [Candida dubliniensis CD36]CAX40469.1 subunit of the histone acetyltransferase SAGA complex, putative [Candida dubliniensis CD36]